LHLAAVSREPILLPRLSATALEQIATVRAVEVEREHHCLLWGDAIAVPANEA
jgi:hypothetical protein